MTHSSSPNKLRSTRASRHPVQCSLQYTIREARQRRALGPFKKESILKPFLATDHWWCTVSGGKTTTDGWMIQWGKSTKQGKLATRSWCGEPFLENSERPILEVCKRKLATGPPKGFLHRRKGRSRPFSKVVSTYGIIQTL